MLYQPKLMSEEESKLAIETMKPLNVYEVIGVESFVSEIIFGNRKKLSCHVFMNHNEIMTETESSVVIKLPKHDSIKGYDSWYLHKIFVYGQESLAAVLCNPEAKDEFRYVNLY